MAEKDWYKHYTAEYHDYVKLWKDSKAEDMKKWILSFKDADDYILNGVISKKYLKYEKILLKYGEQLDKQFMASELDKDQRLRKRYKELWSLYCHGFSHAMWKAQTSTKELEDAYKHKDAKRFINAVVANSKDMQAFAGEIARVENWLRLNHIPIITEIKP